METATTEEVKFLGITSEQIDAIWGEVKPFIERSLKYANGELDQDDVYRFLKERAMQLWVLLTMPDQKITMCGVTEIVNYPRKKVCRVVLMGGIPSQEWRDNVHNIETWAKGQGCSTMEACVRKGIAKVMAEQDYKKVYTIVSKELENAI